MENRPQGREKHVTGQGKDFQKKGEGLNSGPVGRQDGYSGRQQFGQSNGNSRRPTEQSRTTRASGGHSPLGIIAVIAALLLGGGGYGISNLLGGSDSAGTSSYSSGGSYGNSYGSSYSSSYSGSYSSGYGSGYTTGSDSTSGLQGGTLDLSSLLGGSVGSGWTSGSYGGSSVSSGWTETANTGSLDTSVAAGAREKRTRILGNGKDTVTIMVYMCGTDLESRSGMGSSDLQEMLNATIGEKINLLVYTGGCRQWKNNRVSSQVNQIYEIRNGKLTCLVENDGTAAMTSPSTLTRFIQYCTRKYPANRNELILWDHGGGSLSGYGYDEKNVSSGSMTLKGIDEALKNAETTFDFIGFDACLMATLENGLMLDSYADYLIASEETEPGVGWYYTNWLTKLNQNPSMATVEIGRNIVDDFVSTCQQKCRGQKTTLSVVDLAELTATVPERLKEFASSTSELMKNDQYEVVSNARSNAREFASSTRIDQIDLAHLAYNMNTDEGKELAEAIRGAVKYNRTSSDITNAYGLSIYFPYQKAYKVDSAVETYEAIGMDSEYARCIQEFASMETGGQAMSGGAVSPMSVLMGSGSSASSYGSYNQDAIYSLLTGLMSGNFAGVEGLNSSNSAYLGRAMDPESMSAYLSSHRFDDSQLVWSDVDGVPQLRMSEDQWSLVQDLCLNVFYDVGDGYIDLGLDNVFSFTEDGALLGEYDGTWLAIDDQPVAYYYENTVISGEHYTITGRVPVLLNGERANLILVFDDENPYGSIVGARRDYVDGETETVSKSEAELNPGDHIEFVFDEYRYDGSYENSYVMGEMTYQGNHTISNVILKSRNTVATYLFTDIYCQEHWTPVIP